MARRSQTNLPSPQPPSRLRHGDYTVAIICPMGDELSPVLALLDEVHENLGTGRDQNAYKLGRMGHHNVVVAGMPEIGNNAAAMVATQLLNDFSQIRFALLVGIGGGIPDEDYDDDDLNDIRLGDVVVGHSRGAYGGVIQFDRGKATTEGFVVTGHQSRPPHVLAANVEILKASHNLHGDSIPRYLGEMLARYPGMKEKYSSPGPERDCVFEAGYTHEGGKTCKNCNISRIIEREHRRTENPRIHYGTIGSSNTVVKDSNKRDTLRKMGVLCVEMEAAGLMEAFPCLVIRGISDYADSHKNKKWQPYAAATAAAYSKELLLQIPKVDVQRTQSITDALDGLSMTVDRVDQRTRILVGQTQSEAEIKILEWLSSSAVNFSSLQNESQQTHTAGTGQWLLDHESYQNWRDHKPGLIWLHGVGISTIIRNIQNNFPHSAYWYFRFDNQISQDVSQMLRSIIRQLSSSPLPEEIQSLFELHGQRGSEPSLEELVTALNGTIDLLAQDVYIVLDALDECPHKDKKGQRDRLLHCINILGRTHPHLHLLVTSRPEPDIERELRSIATCDFDIEKLIRSDVERFVKITLEDPCLASWAEDVRDQIVSKLLEHEERRFRWADLQIKRFAQCPNLEQLQRAMHSIPKDLEAAYQQAFDTIDDENTYHVAKIMMWLAAALEPLTADQIAAIAGFRDPEYVLRICSTLLVTVIDEDTTRIIKLAHFSVKEFLILKLNENSTQWYRFTMEHANKQIARFALKVLIDYGPVCEDRQMKKVLPYVAQYWPRHAGEGLKTDNRLELEEQINLFFSNECIRSFLGWLKIHNPDNVDGYQRYRAAGPLYYASLLGFQSAVSKMWVNYYPFPINEGSYGNALNAAAINGNVDVVRWILRNFKFAASCLNFVRVVSEIKANVTECVAEICNGLPAIVITIEVVNNVLANNSSGQHVMKALLENRSDEIRVTEEILVRVVRERAHGRPFMELFLKHKRDEVIITNEVVKAVWSTGSYGQQVLKTVLDHRGNEARITESVIRIIEDGESDRKAMEWLLEETEKANQAHFTEEITSLVVGNFNACAVRLLLEERRERIPMTEIIIKAAVVNRSHGSEVTELLLEAGYDKVQLSEAVILAATRQGTRGQQVLEVLLRKATFKSPITSSTTCIIAERFDAHTMELLLGKHSEDILLTEEVLKSVASNADNGQKVLEVLLSKKREKVQLITEDIVRAAAGNHRSGSGMMELLLSERADTVQITDKLFMLVASHWDGARLMELLVESTEYNAIEEKLAIAESVDNMAAVEALQKKLDDPTAMFNEAISRRDEKKAELLLENGAQHKNNGWRYSLRLAAGFGLTGVVELLLKIGVDQTADGEDGRTPLLYAIRWGYIDTAELLLKHGADITAKDTYGNTALSIASMSGRLQVINMLLQMGADHTVRDGSGLTPLMIASERGFASIVDLLLTHRVDCEERNSKGQGALCIAAYHGHLEVVDMLLRYGADPESFDSKGCTPLMAASDQGFAYVAKLLLEYGADLSVTGKCGQTAVNHAASAGHLKVTDLLIEHGADLKVADNLGNTALHNASFKGHVEVATLLIKNGADLALLNGSGWTPLHFASYSGNIRMIELLLLNGANFAITDTIGRTALHCASYYGHVEVVRILVDRGAPTRTTDKYGYTPLHLASGQGHANVVAILLPTESGLLPLRDANGFTALRLASQLGHKDVVDVLEGKSTKDKSVA
ncbi:hypothetical protein E8E14_003859 [Neopestalotiopsis sp. 37M]|nr:hypothetical protein E8E14_003859 [Neopestalotiopsis sp. 37M]